MNVYASILTLHKIALLSIIGLYIEYELQRSLRQQILSARNILTDFCFLISSMSFSLSLLQSDAAGKHTDKIKVRQAKPRF